MGSTSRWISKAVQRVVSKLDVRIKTYLVENLCPKPNNPPEVVPTTAFANNTLVKLTLGTWISLGTSLEVAVDLPLLKSLFLHTVWLRDKDLCDLLTQGCPELEELYVEYKYIDDEEGRFDIPSVPHYLCHHNIKKLTVRYKGNVKLARSLSFDAPNLSYLDYSDYLPCEYKYANFSNTLLEARLDIALRIGNRWKANCSELISYVMYACLHNWGNHDEVPFFKNLTTLCFGSKRQECWKLLSNMIENYPKLETLVLKFFCCIGNSGVTVGGNVVKVLEIQGYKGRRRELNQMKCFFREMEFLEEVKVKKISDKTDNKLQLANDLLALPKCSPNCRIYVL